MLPFVIKELAEMVMKKKALLLDDALHYIYTTNLYKSLLDENTKQWYSSTIVLYKTIEASETYRQKKHYRYSRDTTFSSF